MKALLVLVVTVLTFSTATAQSAEELLQQALTLERSQGDYTGAIALYKRVSETAGVERKLAGKALIQMAQAYENLGRSDAAQTYQRVLDDYGDLPELAIEAREGYARTHSPAAPSEPPPGSRSTFEFPEEWDDWGATLSPSGRHLLAVLGDDSGLGVLEVQSRVRQVISPNLDGRPLFPRFSPDESEIATGWISGNSRIGGSGVLLKVDRASGAHENLLSLSDHLQARNLPAGDYNTVQVLDWSRDGSQVLAWITSSDNGLANRAEEFVVVDVESRKATPVPDSRVSWTPEGSYSRHWDQGCFTSDGSAILADYVAFDSGQRQGTSFIRRFDLDSGRASTWRASAAGDLALWACTWKDEGAIIYSLTALGSTSLYRASPTDPDGSSDELITSFPKETYTFAGSKQGDVPLLENWGMSAFDLAINPDTGQMTGPPRPMPHAPQCGARWNSVGTMAALAERTGFTTRVRVWNPDRDRYTMLDLGDRMVLGCNLEWISATVLSVGFRARDSAPITPSWDVVLVDVSTGKIIDEISHTAWDGFQRTNGFTMHPDGRLFAWDQDRGCILALDRHTRETEDLVCDHFSGASSAYAIPVPTGDRLFVAAFGPEEPATYAITNLDGSNYRLFAEPDQCQMSWAGPTTVALACGPRIGKKSIERVDIETGLVSPFLTGLSDLLAIRHLATSPTGDRAIVVGVPQARWEAPATVTIYHRLTARD